MAESVPPVVGEIDPYITAQPGHGAAHGMLPRSEAAEYVHETGGKQWFEEDGERLRTNSGGKIRDGVFEVVGSNSTLTGHQEFDCNQEEENRYGSGNEIRAHGWA
jgi:hypothetical protein